MPRCTCKVEHNFSGSLHCQSAFFWLLLARSKHHESCDLCSDAVRPGSATSTFYNSYCCTPHRATIVTTERLLRPTMRPQSSRCSCARLPASVIRFSVTTQMRHCTSAHAG